MHLYLSDNPRTLYLATSSQDERRGCPARALVFRATQGSSSQAVVEFLPKSTVDLSSAVKLTSRVVKGCLGLISIANGTSPDRVRNTSCPLRFIRYVSCRHSLCDRSRQHKTFLADCRDCGSDSRRWILLLDLVGLG